MRVKFWESFFNITFLFDVKLNKRVKVIKQNLHLIKRVLLSSGVS